MDREKNASARLAYAGFGFGFRAEWIQIDYCSKGNDNVSPVRSMEISQTGYLFMSDNSCEPATPADIAR